MVQDRSCIPVDSIFIYYIVGGVGVGEKTRFAVIVLPVLRLR